MTSPPWIAHTVKQRWAWHAIIALGQHRQSNGVKHGMPSSPLDGKHGRTTSGVTCHHRLWTAHTVEHRRAWHAIIAFRQHTRSDDVGRGMTSPPLDCTHLRTTSGVAIHHRPLTAHTVSNISRDMTLPPLDSTHGQQRWARNDITALGQHTQSNDVGCGMPSSPFGSTNG